MSISMLSARAFNRTIVELKPMRWHQLSTLRRSFNRTIVELKLRRAGADAGKFAAFNRTIVELKLNMAQFRGTGATVF